MSTKAIKRIYIFCLALVTIMIVTGLILCRGTSVAGLNNDYAQDVGVDVMGMLVCWVLAVGIYAGKEKDTQNMAMFRMIFVLIVLFFLDLLSSYMEGNADYVQSILAVNTLVFIYEDVLGYSYWAYIKEELKLGGRTLYIADRLCLVALGINIILDLLNIKFGWFFTISSSGVYIDSRYEFMCDMAIIAIFIIAAAAIVRKKDISIVEKIILFSFEAFPLVAYIASSITQEYTWNYPAYLFSILLIYIRIFAEREKKIANQQVLLTKQSTALMISQIQPHFLYNVLTTISNLCVTDPEEAEETTVLFSQYLRTNLDSLRNQEPVPFATELMHIKTYVELEKKRFGDILNVEYDINEQSFKVPSLGLQPIVENSIKHGIRGKNAPGHIKIGTYKCDSGYEIIIEDDGIGFDMNMPAKDDGRSHVGMTNVKERLKQMCNASVTVESSPGNGCKTVIIIPE